MPEYDVPQQGGDDVAANERHTRDVFLAGALGLASLSLLPLIVGKDRPEPTVAPPERRSRTEEGGFAAILRGFSGGNAPPSQTEDGTGAGDVRAAVRIGGFAGSAGVALDFDPFGAGRNESDEEAIARLLASGRQGDPAEKRIADLQVLVALVPDPVNSRFPDESDQTIDALQRAAERLGFVIDRYGFPWTPRSSRHPSAAPVSDAEADAEPPDRGSGRGVRQEGTVGVLLFRTPGASPAKLLAVLLVGETPTAGVDKTALTRALRLARVVQDHVPGRRSGSTAGHPIPVLGPHYSGSQLSVRFAIQDFLDANGIGTKIRLISGSASAVDPSVVLPPEAVPTPPDGPFRATVHGSDVLRTELLRFVCSHRAGLGFSKWRVAWLAEANTGFGAAGKPPGEGAGEAPGQPPETPKRATETEMDVLHYRFPIYVSRLAAAYAEQGLLDSVLPASTYRPSGQVHIPMQQENDAGDILPPFAPRMATVQAETLLANILADVRKENVGYVGITATDVRDRLFLARLVKQHVPGVQLLMEESDLLYTHPDVTPYTQGMLVASTYPLVTRNQEWTPSAEPRPNERVSLSSDFAVGTFNAALALLGGEDLMIEYSEPLQRNGGKAPPVWIGMVGDEIYPLTVADLSAPDAEQPEDRNLYQRTHELKVQSCTLSLEFPALWLAAYTGGAILFAGLAFYVHRHSPLERLQSKTSTVGDKALRGTAERCGLWFVTLCGLLHLYCTRPLFISLKGHFECGSSPTRLALAASIVVAALAVTVALILAVVAGKCVGRLWKLGLSERQKLWADLAVALCGAAALVVAYSDLGWWSPSVNAVLLFNRTVDLAGGTSPVPPTVFAAASLGVWLWTARRRLETSLEERSDCPIPDSYQPGATGFESTFEAIRSVDTTLRARVDGPLCFLASNNRQAVFAIVFLLLGAASVLAAKFVPTVERHPFDWFFFLGASVTAGLVAVAGLDLNYLWKDLHHLHSRLLLLPMAAAYDRLPKPVSAFFGRYLDARHSRSAQKEMLHKQALHLVKCSRRLREAEIGRYRSPAARGGEDGSDDARLPPDGDLVLKLLDGLGARWLRRSVRDGFAEPAPARVVERPPGCPSPADPAASAREAVRAADEASEDFLALRFVIYTSQFFVQMRQLALGVVFSSVLLLCSVMSYPFEPQHLIVLSAALLAASVVGLVVYILVQIDRDELVSRVVDTKPNELTWDRAFFASLGKYAAPVLFVLLLNVPVVSQTLRSLLDPYLRALRH